MKTLILIVAILLCLCGLARANEPNEPVKDKAITFWLNASNPAYQNTDIGVLAGIRKGNTEIGAAFEWRAFSEGDTEPDTQSHFAVGPFAVYHFPGVLDVDNPGIPFLPEKLAGDPFIGLSYVFDVQGKGSTFAPFGGTRIFDLFALTAKYSIYEGQVPARNEWRYGLSLQLEF